MQPLLFEVNRRSHGKVVGGDTLTHTDIRSDNVLIDPDGRALICDWNWPVRAASWFDSFDTVSGLLALDAASRVWVPGPLSSTMNLFAAVHAAAVGARLAPDPAGG